MPVLPRWIGAVLAGLVAVASADEPVRLEQVATGFDSVTAYVHVPAAGGHRYVAEQPGRVRLLAPGADVPGPVFVDLTDRVVAVGFEQGLTGLAMAPDFPADPRFFVHYTRADGASVVARFLLDDGDPTRADPTSELVMLVVPQPHPTHNCNQLAFAPDGMLWIGCGDGGSGSGPILDPQWLGHLLGKLLRVDVSALAPGEAYRIPKDNPFLHDPAARPEIWANGLRNPYRFSFDEATGDLWLADVGQAQWEEINRVPRTMAPANYGWPVLEGTHCWPPGTACNASDYQMPLHQYSHDDGRCSVIGGLRLRDPTQPILDGAYLFADFCSGEVFAVRERGNGDFRASRIGHAAGRLPTVFGRDVDGAVVVGTYGFGNAGILRLVGVDSVFAHGFGE